MFVLSLSHELVAADNCRVVRDGLCRVLGKSTGNGGKNLIALVVRICSELIYEYVFDVQIHLRHGWHSNRNGLRGVDGHWCRRRCTSRHHYLQRAGNILAHFFCFNSHCFGRRTEICFQWIKPREQRYFAKL